MLQTHGLWSPQLQKSINSYYLLPNRFLQWTDRQVSDFWDSIDIDRTIQKAVLIFYLKKKRGGGIDF